MIEIIAFVHEYGFNCKAVEFKPDLSSVTVNGPSTMCQIRHYIVNETKTADDTKLISIL